MPVLYGLDAKLRLVHLVTIGDASFDEWREALLGVFSNSSFHTGFNFLSDGRNGRARSRVFIEQMAAFAREHEREFGRCRWASVVADLGADDAARLLTIRAGLGRVEVRNFFDVEEARRWLLSGTATNA
ncbi:MAG TPA: hypothetical protein VF586_10940 [Pyrinomonadaceae bacterium]|jgi:hypothetical protein